jgi:hypothetical protein
MRWLIVRPDIFVRRNVFMRWNALRASTFGAGCASAD